MSDKKRKKVYEALIEGATSGLADKDLFAFVIEKCPHTSSKRMVRASLMALSDPDVKDPKVLHAVYALAIKHRLDGGLEESPDEIEEQVEEHRKAKRKPSHEGVDVTDATAH